MQTVDMLPQLVKVRFLTFVGGFDSVSGSIILSAHFISFALLLWTGVFYHSYHSFSFFNLNYFKAVAFLVACSDFCMAGTNSYEM